MRQRHRALQGQTSQLGCKACERGGGPLRSLRPHSTGTLTPLPRQTRTLHTALQRSEFFVLYRKETSTQCSSKLPPIHGHRLPMESYPDKSVKIFIHSWRQVVVVKLSKLRSVCPCVLARASTWQLCKYARRSGSPRRCPTPPHVRPVIHRIYFSRRRLPLEAEHFLSSVTNRSHGQSHHQVNREGNLAGETRSSRTHDARARRNRVLLVGCPLDDSFVGASLCVGAFVQPSSGVCYREEAIGCLVSRPREGV